MRTYHKSLKVFFDWCIREKRLPLNPAAGIKLQEGAEDPAQALAT